MSGERYNAATIIDANLEAGRGERTALFFGDERITYGQLFGRVSSMARALKALGVGRESRVLPLLADTPAFAVAFFGALRAGAIAVPLNPAFRAADYRYLLEDTSARAIVAESSVLDKLGQALEELRPGSSGKPVPGYELRIVGEDGQLAATGETGDLLVKGASAAPFYWHEREKSRRTMLGAWTATGDRYRMDEDGFYWYEGRADDMLKIGGEWVSPIEIENALVKHEAVREAAVVGIPVDGIMRIRAVVVLDPGRERRESTAAELRAWCKGRLLPFQYPHIVDFVDKLPKTATGKVQRFQLRRGGDER